MWTVVYMAHSKDIADKLCKEFEKNNLLVKVRPVNKCSETDGCYEILVPESEVEQSHEIIIELGF